MTNKCLQIVAKEKEHIFIFTNKEVRESSNKDLFWSVYAKMDTKEVNFIKDFTTIEFFCDCSSCQKYKKEISELSSLCHALEWVSRNEAFIPITVFVSSELISSAISEPEAFSEKINESGNCQLKALYRRWEMASMGFDIEMFTYHYENKDLIQNFLKTFELKEKIKENG